MIRTSEDTVTDSLNESFQSALVDTLASTAAFATMPLDRASLAQIGELHWHAAMLVGILDAELTHRDHTADFAERG